MTQRCNRVRRRSTRGAPTVMLDGNPVSYLFAGIRGKGGQPVFSSAELAQLRLRLQTESAAGRLTIPLTIPLVQELAGIRRRRPRDHAEQVTFMMGLTAGRMLLPYPERVRREVVLGRRLREDEAFVALAGGEEGAARALLDPTNADADAAHVLLAKADFGQDERARYAAMRDRFEGLELSGVARRWWDPARRVSMVDEWCRREMRHDVDLRACLPEDESAWPSPRSVPSLWCATSYRLARLFRIYADRLGIDAHDLYDGALLESAAYATTFVTSDRGLTCVAKEAPVPHLRVVAFATWGRQML